MNKKVLMIASQEIINDISDGGKRVSNRNWRLLNDLFGKENVFLLIFNPDHCFNDCYSFHVTRIAPFRNVFERVYNILRGDFFLNGNNRKSVINFLIKESIDLVFIDRSLFGNLAQDIKKYTDSEIWVFSHNYEVNYFFDKFRKNQVLALIFGYLTRHNEKKTVTMADKVITLTSRDSMLYFEHYKKEADVILPVSFDDSYDCNKAKEPSQGTLKKLLFIGSNFNANYDGIVWFINNVMPELADYQLMIVGKNFEKNEEELSRSNVRVIGTVENLESYYYEDNIIVMPIFYGSGQKVKTAEAMMYGKTVVATSEALEGYEIEGVNGIYICNNKAEFIKVIKSITVEDITNARIEVRKLFEKEYSYKGVCIKARSKLLGNENDKAD